MGTARIAEAILRDEQAVIPIGSFNPKYGVTLAVASVLSRHGLSQIFEPPMSEEERQGPSAQRRNPAECSGSNDSSVRTPFGS